MKALIQRVLSSQLSVEDEVLASIEQGLLVFLAIEPNDDIVQADKLLQKIICYRIFSNADGKMNLNVQQVNGEILIVSQFTLAADTSTGLRPSFSSAASPELALKLYRYFVAQAKTTELSVQTGVFGADMQVQLVNDGPVSFMLEV